MKTTEKRILHLEDSEEIQKFISIALSEIAEVTSVATLKEAMVLVQSTKFNLIIVDFTLPDGSGSELINYLATHDRSIPIIVFSEHEISNTMVNVKSIFVKSRFSPKLLVESVRKYCL